MSSPVLEAREVSFAYPGASPTLATWSAEFHAGTVTALTGPSGRGKSTLLYLLGMMLLPAEGDVLVHGESTVNLRDAGRARLRADRFGFVFQDAALDATRSVLDNVIEGALYRPPGLQPPSVRALELLERFGVNVPPGRKPGQVSGGQAQRIALCRALLNDPEILLADEPTGNLDPSSAELVVDALKRQAEEGSAVIVVTHSPEVAASCDRRIQL